LQINQRAQVDVELQVGAVGETVQITGSAPLLESQSSVLGSVIQEQQVQDLPLNGRNFVQLAVLSPGVGGAGQGMRGTIMSEYPTGRSASGHGASSSTAIAKAPATISTTESTNNDRLTLAIIVRPAVEAIKEFKIQTSLLFGRAGAKSRRSRSTSSPNRAATTCTARSMSFCAIARSTPTASSRIGPAPPSRSFSRTSSAARLDGRLLRDKTFFFGDYDGFRQNLGRLFVNTVPTLKMRQGDFSEVPGGIFDPATTVRTEQPLRGNRSPTTSSRAIAGIRSWPS
jgi:hypothetical protein